MAGFDGADYHWITEDDRPETIGRLSAFAGNAGVLLRAYVYARMLGREGMVRVSEYSTLNANYMQQRLRGCHAERAPFLVLPTGGLAGGLTNLRQVLTCPPAARGPTRTRRSGPRRRERSSPGSPRK